MKNFIFIHVLYFYISKLIYCQKITLEEFNNYFNNRTLDRVRQIYWNTIIDLGNINAKSKENAEYFHLWNRKAIMYRLETYYDYIDKNMSLDIKGFEKLMNGIDLFTLNNTDYLFSEEMPRNFLINFAINIDKYERIKTQKIDGIIDYINYYTNDKIIEYLKNKYNEYKDEIEKNFDEIVLNNIKLNFNNVQEYYQSKTIEQLIDIVYGIENYYFNILGISNDAFYFYQHEDLITKSNKEIHQIIALYNKEIDINYIDNFMYQIEFRNFSYINNKKFVENFKDELSEKIYVLEKYHKRQQNLTKSLRGLTEYVKKMNKPSKQNILIWGLSLYPELYCEEIFEDISSSDFNLKYGEVKEFIQVKERNILLKYAYNIHIYQNEIKSIYDDRIFNLFRYKNDKLYELILSDSNNNRNLQEKISFTDFADLQSNNLYIYLSYLQKNQLKKIMCDLTAFYYENNNYILPYEIHSEIRTNTQVLEFDDKVTLLAKSYSYLNSLYLDKIPSTSEFLNFLGNYSTQYCLSNYLWYFNNTYDFLRSTDINYLKQWLRKFEIYSRNYELINDGIGGLKFNYFDEYSKDDLLEIYDIYIEKYKELFEPIEFIKYSGLDNDITPHKMIVELFYSSSEEDYKIKEIMKIAYSLTGYYQRKNIQTSFNITKFLNDLNYTLYNNKKKIYLYIYQFFRLINIFPELNNKKIFEIICLNETTRVINLLEEDHFESFFKRDKLKIARNIQYYLNNTKNEDNKNLDNMSDEELKKYILDFLNNPIFNEKDDLKSRIIDGDFYPIIYDYYESYLSNITESHLNFIFNNIKNLCAQNYPCSEISNAKTFEEKKNEIINDIKNVEEFQNPSFFDKNFDFIENNEKDSFCEFLLNSTNKNLFLYTIIANIIKFETCENSDDFKCQYLPKDIYYQIIYKSRNEMIRYILKIKEINKNMINENMLPILIKYYMLDIGSDDIYDLTLF